MRKQQDEGSDALFLQTELNLYLGGTMNVASISAGSRWFYAGFQSCCNQSYVNLFPSFSSFIPQWREHPLKRVKVEHWKDHEEEIAKILTDEKCSFGLEKHYIEQILGKLDDTNLKSLLECVAQRLIQEPATFTLDRVEQVITRARLEAVVEKTAYEHLTARNSVPLQKPKKYTPPRFLRWMQEQLDLYLKALGVLGRSKTPTSDWDKFYQFFTRVTALSFPFYIMQYAIQVCTPVYAYFITVVLTALISAALVLYVKKLRPLPLELSDCCRDLRLSPSEFFAEREEVIKRLLFQIQTHGKSLLIIGESGVGKSSLVKELAKRLKNKNVYRLDQSIFADEYSTVLDKMREPFEEASKYPGNVIFYLDECSLMVKDKPFINQLKMDLEQSSGKPVYQFIGTCNEKQGKKIHEALEKNSRAKLVRITVPDDEELLRILLEYYNCCALDVYSSDIMAVLRSIVEKSNDEELKLGAKLRASITVLEHALVQLRESDHQEQLDLCKRYRAIEAKAYMQGKNAGTFTHYQMLAGFVLDRVKQKMKAHPSLDEEIVEQVVNSLKE